MLTVQKYRLILYAVLEETLWWIRTILRRVAIVRELRQSIAKDVVSLYYNGRTLPGSYAIGRAFALADGRFVRHDSIPILRPGRSWEVLRPGRSWDANRIKDPYVVDLGENIYMYYSGNSRTLSLRTLENRIGLAMSSDGGETFRKSGVRPILDAGATGEWDSGGVAFPVVVHEDSEKDPKRRWKMWYRGTDDMGMHRVGLATSSDGSKWTKFSGNPVVTDLDDAGYQIHTNPHEIVRHHQRYFLFTHSEDGMNVHTTSCPEGLYEPSHRNPILTPRLHAAQPLSHDAALGDQFIHVDDTSVFEPMEFVLIHDNGSEPMLTRVTAIDYSASRLTIRDSVRDRYMVARKAFVRSVYCNGMAPRAVYKEKDHWISLMTIMPGLILREYTGVAFSKSLDGPYTIDFRRGLVLEPDAVNSKWDQDSIENFCAVKQSMPSDPDSVDTRVMWN